MTVTQQTVLVLGAGASADFGFPLGVQLRNLVCSSVPHGSTKAILSELGHSDTDLRAFVDELRYSGYRSVDMFLERNPHYMEIGKHATAAVLLPFETEAQLFPPGAPVASWYEYLAAKTDAGSDDWSSNRLSVVTFNYDRSLEHYFSRIIAQRRHISLIEAFQIFSQLPVIHLHGTLGDYSDTTATGLPYGASVSAGTVREAAQRIQVVSEVDDTLPAFEQAHSLLVAAQRIFFIGFGFNADNVRRLRYFQDPPATPSSVEVTGTTIGYTPREWPAVESSILHGHWSGPPYAGSAMEFFWHRVDLT